MTVSRRGRLGLGLLGLCAVVLALPFLLLTAADAGLMNGALVAAFKAKTHRVLNFQTLHLHLLSADPTIQATQLVIGSPPDITPLDLARIGEGTLHLRLLPLLWGKLKLTEVELNGVDLHLVRLGHSRNNYSLGGAGLSATLAPVRRLSLTGGHVSYDDPQRSLMLKADAAYDPQTPRPLRLTGGGVIRGAPYQVEAQGAPLNGRDPKAPYPFQATLVDGATRMQADGTSQKPFDFRGFDLAVDASGPNLADLGYLFNVTAPNSPPFKLKTQIKRVAHVVSLHGIDARFGASDLHGDLISDHNQPRRKFTATLTAGALTAADIAVLASPRPDHAVARSTAGTVGRAASEKGSFADKSFDLDGLRKVDAAVDLRARRLTGYAVPFTDVVARLRLENGHLSLQPLSASLSPGGVSARLTLDARAAAPLLQASAAVRGARISVLRPAAAKTLDGIVDASAEFHGTGTSAQTMATHLQGRAAFRVDQGMIKRTDAEALGGDPLQAAWLQFVDKGAAVPLRCASGLFTVANGVATPHNLKIDTGAGATVGHGAIDFNAGRIDLLLQPIEREGSKPSLAAPIHIVGDLAHPKVSVDVKPAVKKSGLGVIAAVIGTPFRAAADPKKAPPPLEPCPLAF